ncbi:MAG: ABC transporter substrate-binding protein [Planctomycetes bacterium]|nr:ABC transporter substrate-binding protein [Planctomycetota bacterium]
MDKLHVSATSVAMNYLPEYLAVELGYFKDADLEVSSEAPSDWTDVLKHVDSGRADIVLGGIWVPSIYKNRVKDYFAFAKVTSRFSSLLLGREPRKVEDFKWTDMEGKTLLIPGSGGASGGMYLPNCAREGGADMSKINVIYDFPGDILTECFLGGWGDMISLMAHAAASLVEAGKAHIIADLTTWHKSVPWSVYYAPAETFQDPALLDKLGRYTLGLQRGTTWLLEHDAKDCADLLQRKWPKVPVNAAVDTVNMLRDQGMWDKTVRIKEDELARWEGFMVDTYVIDKPLDYEQIVDRRPFEYAAKQLGIDPMS